MDNVKTWVAEKRAQAEILRTIPPGKQRIMSFATFIEQLPHSGPFQDHVTPGFSMHLWSNMDWTSPACIGGWIDRIWPSAGRYIPSSLVLSVLTGKYEDSDLGGKLFFCDGFDTVYSSITPQMAATVLRHFAETGEVDWNIARRL